MNPLLSRSSTQLGPKSLPRPRTSLLLLLLLPLRPSRSFSSSTTPFSSTRTLNKQHHLSHCAKRYICFRRTCLIIYIQPPSGTRLLTSSPLPLLSSLPGSSGTVSFSLSSLEIRKKKTALPPSLSIINFFFHSISSNIVDSKIRSKEEERKENRENWKERLRARETNYQGGMPVLESVMKFDLAIGTTR